jgi:hypothetical protein
MKNPDWLTEAAAAAGSEVLRGITSREAGIAAVAAAVKAHPGFINDVIYGLAAREVGRWLQEHESSGDLFQAQMFPGLPASLRVAPKRRTAIADMTAEDLDHAKNMLWARTGNAVKGAEEAAERERAAFSRLYEKVRPLLSGDLTVGDVIGKLTAREDAA